MGYNLGQNTWLDLRSNFLAFHYFSSQGPPAPHFYVEDTCQGNTIFKQKTLNGEGLCVCVCGGGGLYEGKLIRGITQVSKKGCAYLPIRLYAGELIGGEIRYITLANGDKSFSKRIFKIIHTFTE